VCLFLVKRVVGVNYVDIDDVWSAELLGSVGLLLFCQYWRISLIEGIVVLVPQHLQTFPLRPQEFGTTLDILEYLLVDPQVFGVVPVLIHNYVVQIGSLHVLSVLLVPILLLPLFVWVAGDVLAQEAIDDALSTFFQIVDVVSALQSADYLSAERTELACHPLVAGGFDFAFPQGVIVACIEAAADHDQVRTELPKHRHDHALEQNHLLPALDVDLRVPLFGDGVLRHVPCQIQVVSKSIFFAHTTFVASVAVGELVACVVSVNAEL